MFFGFVAAIAELKIFFRVIRCALATRVRVDAGKVNSLARPHMHASMEKANVARLMGSLRENIEHGTACAKDVEIRIIRILQNMEAAASRSASLGRLATKIFSPTWGAVLLVIRLIASTMTVLILLTTAVGLPTANKTKTGACLNVIRTVNIDKHCKPDAENQQYNDVIDHQG
jgi:hypothetical protein